MRWALKTCETPKFRKLREKLTSTLEREALKEAVGCIVKNPVGAKKLKGEFKDFRKYRYSVQGQERRLIYKVKKDIIYLLSFGPREGIYK